MKKIFFVVILLLIFPLNLLAADYTYDLGISADDINFSDALVAGQTVRLYASIHNYGTEDTAGYVTFYQGEQLIADSQVISVRVDSVVDEVYVDFVVPIGSFNIRTEINGQDPGDDNSANDLAVTSLFVPDPDNDGDGLSDEADADDDNDGITDQDEEIYGTNPKDEDSDDDGCLDGQDDFPLDPERCVDTDNDGIDDKQDIDDDNDGLTDEQEEDMGTDSKDPDTDDDSVMDGYDDYPLDPSRYKKTTTFVQNQDQNQDEDQDQDQNSDEENNEEGGEDGNNKEKQGEGDQNKKIDLDGLDDQLNPKVKIKAKKTKWNTYVFEPELRGVLDENLVYQWDFGDGAKSSQKIFEHKYKRGEYTVSLKVLGANDLELNATEEVSVSIGDAIKSFMQMIANLFKKALSGLAMGGCSR